jgi:hypothetical protein
MVLSSLNTFGNITHSVNTTPPGPLPPTLANFYSLATISKVSDWGTANAVDIGYTYQLDRSVAKWSKGVNPNSVPSSQGYAISEDGITIAFPVKKFYGTTFQSFGILASDNSGSTWAFVDLSSSTYGSLRVRSMTASASCDVIYLWVATSTITTALAGNQYICKWTSDYGSIRVKSSWKFGNGYGNASSLYFLPTSYSDNRVQTYVKQYGNITTDYSGNVLYMNQTYGTQSVLFYAPYAKTRDPSDNWETNYAYLSDNVGGAFWAKVSGNGRVVWWMTGQRVIYCGIFDSNYNVNQVTQCLPSNIGGDAYWSPNTQFALSYDGTNCICGSINAASGGFQWFRVTMTTDTTTLDLSSIVTATTGKNIYTASGDTFKNIAGTMVNGIDIGYINVMAMCNNSAYPYLIMGGCTDTTTNHNEYTSRIVLARSYKDISTNYAGGAIGTTNSTTFKEAKTMDIPDAYVVGVSISPINPLTMLLTTTGVDAYNGTITSNGGSLYIMKA